MRMEFLLLVGNPPPLRVKAGKLTQQLKALHGPRKVQRKLFEATLGLLMWATSTCPHLRPYMAPLYRDLHSAAGTLNLIHPRMWQSFLGALEDLAKVAQQPPGLWLPFKAQVIRAGSHEINCKADLPKVISAQKGMLIRIADPQRSTAMALYMLCTRPQAHTSAEAPFALLRSGRRQS